MWEGCNVVGQPQGMFVRHTEEQQWGSRVIALQIASSLQLDKCSYCGLDFRGVWRGWGLITVVVISAVILWVFFIFPSSSSLFFFFVADSPLFALRGSASSGIADVAELLTVSRVGETLQLLLKAAFMTVLLSVVSEAQVKPYLCKTVLPIPVPFVSK